MTSPIASPAIVVLVLGDARAAQARADGLRLRGFASFVAQNDAELTWLMSIAKVRPNHAVVDLDLPMASARERVEHLLAMARMVAVARIPVVLVGADDADARFFHHVLAQFPDDPGDTAILSVLTESAA